MSTKRVATLSRVAPELPVYDLRKAIEYYEQQLGFHLVMQIPGGDYAIVERDAIAIHLFQDATRVHSRVAIHIFTDQLDDINEELQHRGARISQGIVRKPWGNRDFRVNDDSGNEIKFTESLSENE